MYQDFSYRTVFASSQRAAWQIEDIIGPGHALDFTRPFLPESLARTALPGFDADDRRCLSQIRGHEYLSIFGLVEEFILPFVLDHAREQLDEDDDRVRTLLQFAGEEAKHIALFRRFHEAFTRGFGVRCEMIGPASAIGAEVLRHDPLAVALVILHVEWMTQRHYLDSVRCTTDIDPLFASLLKHHWMEEAQHAKIDTLMVEALAEGRSEIAIRRAVDEYLEIAGFLDAGLEMQAELNLQAFERAARRGLGASDRTAFVTQQHQAARWTYLGSGMTHPKFRRTLGCISPEGLARVDALALHLC